MAAKLISISDDAKVTWENLPGSQGAFSSEAEAVDDTILGQTYGSTDIGLVGWSVSSDGIFKGFSGYLAEIKKVGASSTFTAESMTLVTGKTYQIDDAAKEIWDRGEGTFDILDAASPVAAVDILNVDYLFGRVTFVAGYSVTAPVTVTGASFPTAAIGKANTYSMTMTAEAIDETDFTTAQGNSGTKIFKPGLRSVAIELGGIFDSTENAKDDLKNRLEVIIEVDPAGDGSSIARGFFKLVTTGQSGAVGALEEETLNFALTVPDETTNPIIEFPFSWQHTATTLNLAIQFALTSWLDELNTYDVRYLPTGEEGASPLDGIEGDMIVTDISLSGGLNNMNVFQIELMGTGAFIEV